jgi:alkanesulfonate monooxygenase SsuD/methylene tetrahydromethanopterin reductase-like flavin-dependent oxidoreductase (luciferase family)
VGNWHGLTWDQPLGRTAEYVGMLRRALRGERLVHRGQFYTSQQFRLGVEPLGEVPIYLAADNLKTLRLAGEIADGVLLTWGALDAVPQVVAEIRAGTEGTAATPTTSTWRCICAPV